MVFGWSHRAVHTKQSRRFVVLGSPGTGTGGWADSGAPECAGLLSEGTDAVTERHAPPTSWIVTAHLVQSCSGVFRGTKGIRGRSGGGGGTGGYLRRSAGRTMELEGWSLS